MIFCRQLCHERALVLRIKTIPYALIFDFLFKSFFLQLATVIDVYATAFYISTDLFATLLGICQRGSENTANYVTVNLDKSIDTKKNL